MQRNRKISFDLLINLQQLGHKKKDIWRLLKNCGYLEKSEISNSWECRKIIKIDESMNFFL